MLDDLGEIASHLGLRAPLIVTDRGLARTPWPDLARESLLRAGLRTATFDQVDGTPTARVVAACRAALIGGWHDGLVAVGGGSAIDTAKACSGLVAHGGALADHEGLGRFTDAGPPIIAVPTTPSGGADVSFHAVIAADDRRYAVSGPHLRPSAVVVDPATWRTAPTGVVGDAVIDAFLHAIEAYLARAATPETDALALDGVREIVGAAGVDDPSLASGCMAAGRAMSYANAGLVHALGYPVSTVYGVPHGRANAEMAAAALEWMEPVAPARFEALADVCGTPDLPSAVVGLCARYGVPTAAPALTSEDASHLADLTSGYRPLLDNVPAPVARADIIAIYLRTTRSVSEVDRQVARITHRTGLVSVVGVR